MAPRDQNFSDHVSEAGERGHRDIAVNVRKLPDVQTSSDVDADVDAGGSDSECDWELEEYMPHWLTDRVAMHRYTHEILKHGGGDHRNRASSNGVANKTAKGKVGREAKAVANFWHTDCNDEEDMRRPPLSVDGERRLYRVVHDMMQDTDTAGFRKDMSDRQWRYVMSQSLRLPLPEPTNGASIILAGRKERRRRPRRSHKGAYPPLKDSFVRDGFIHKMKEHFNIHTKTPQPQRRYIRDWDKDHTPHLSEVNGEDEGRQQPSSGVTGDAPHPYPLLKRSDEPTTRNKLSLDSGTIENVTASDGSDTCSTSSDGSTSSGNESDSEDEGGDDGKDEVNGTAPSASERKGIHVLKAILEASCSSDGPLEDEHNAGVTATTTIGDDGKETKNDKCGGETREEDNCVKLEDIVKRGRMLGGGEEEEEVEPKGEGRRGTPSPPPRPFARFMRSSSTPDLSPSLVREAAAAHEGEKRKKKYTGKVTNGPIGVLIGGKNATSSCKTKTVAGSMRQHRLGVGVERSRSASRSRSQSLERASLEQKLGWVEYGGGATGASKPKKPSPPPLSSRPNVPTGNRANKVKAREQSIISHVLESRLKDQRTANKILDQESKGVDARGGEKASQVVSKKIRGVTRRDARPTESDKRDVQSVGEKENTATRAAKLQGSRPEISRLPLAQLPRNEKQQLTGDQVVKVPQPMLTNRTYGLSTSRSLTKFLTSV